MPSQSVPERPPTEAIQALRIEQRQKPHVLTVVSPNDFVCTSDGTIDVQQFWHLPVSLYCLDDDNRRALFVETPQQLDISKSPFLYQAQYEHAQRVLAVPYDLLDRLAAHEVPATRLVFIHSVGRSGSTLLSKAFSNVEASVSLSEPDFYSQVVALRARFPERETELEKLLWSATCVILRLSATHGTAMQVIKFRSFCIGIADLLRSAFPDAGNLFLYRDFEPWMISNARAFLPVLNGIKEKHWQRLVHHFALYLPVLADYLRTEKTMPSRAEMVALQWASVMHRYSELRAQMPILHVNYEKMAGAPIPVLHDIFTFLELPDSGVDEALPAFSRDSQEGSSLSRATLQSRGKVDLDESQWEAVRAITRKYAPAGVDGVSWNPGE